MGIAGSFQKQNAAIARGIALRLLTDGHIDFPDLTAVGVQSPTGPARQSGLEDIIESALMQARWPGRCMTLNFPPSAIQQRCSFIVGIDGAHTPLSLQQCGVWFRENVANQVVRPGQSSAHTPKLAVIFNCGLDRSPVLLLNSLLDGIGSLVIDHAVFCPADSKKLMSDTKSHSLRLAAIRATREYFGDGSDSKYDDDSYPGVNIDEGCKSAPLSTALQWSLLLANVWERLVQKRAVDADQNQSSPAPRATVCRRYSDACQHLLQPDTFEQHTQTENRPLIALVTGSLYLVGSAVQHAERHNALDMNVAR